MEFLIEHKIGQNNPALLQLISENQESFLNMLNEQNEGLDDNESNNGTTRQQSGGEAGTGRRVNREGSGAADGSLGFGGSAGGAAHEPSLSATIPLTPQDRQAIERVRKCFALSSGSIFLFRRNSKRLWTYYLTTYIYNLYSVTH